MISIAGRYRRMLMISVLPSMLGLASSRVRASDLSGLNDLNRDLPTRIEDAMPSEQGKFDLQFSSRYERTDEPTDEWTLRPNLQYGLSPGLQVDLQSSVSAGNGDKRNSGDLEARLLYQVISSKKSAPAAALTFQTTAPTGIDSKGLDIAIGFLATEILGESPFAPCLHLNLEWRNNASALPDERDNHTFAAFGASQLLSNETQLIVDIVHDEGRLQSQIANFIELGLRQSLGENTLAGVSLGTGIGPEASPFIGSLAFQQGLN